MTSNIGSELILEAGDITAKVRGEIEKLLHKHFRPEFLNRIDETVFFKSLAQDDLNVIVKIQLKQLEERLKEKNISFSITPKALEKLGELGYVKEFGARPMKRAIQHYVVSPLAVEMLKHPEKKQFTVNVKKDQLIIE